MRLLGQRGMFVVAVLMCGCAHKHMQDNAAQVADAVAELRTDVERQQLIRTEIARSGVERLARGEAELANHEAARAAARAHSSTAVEGLVRHSRAVSEGADPRFAETIATEVERRETAVEYRQHVDELESLRALLERLSVGVVRGEVELYIELGSAAAAAAKAEWTEAQE
jgi:hypothetical protein